MARKKVVKKHGLEEKEKKRKGGRNLGNISWDSRFMTLAMPMFQMVVLAFSDTAPFCEIVLDVPESTRKKAMSVLEKLNPNQLNILREIADLFVSLHRVLAWNPNIEACLPTGETLRMLMVKRCGYMVSLDSPTDSDSDQTLIEKYPSPENSDEAVVESCDQERLRAALRLRMSARLSEDEILLIEMMHFSGEGTCEFSEVKEQFLRERARRRAGKKPKNSLSLERVRQIYRRALRKLQRDQPLRDVFSEIEQGFV